MNFNVANQTGNDPDPVLQLREEFDAWRVGMVGVPDAVQSTVTMDPPWLRTSDIISTVMTITVLDWRGDKP